VYVVRNISLRLQIHSYKKFNKLESAAALTLQVAWERSPARRSVEIRKLTETTEEFEQNLVSSNSFQLAVSAPTHPSPRARERTHPC
jgi:hypothetical protein